MRLAWTSTSHGHVVKLVLPRQGSWARSFSRTSYNQYLPTPSATGVIGAYTPRPVPNHHAQEIAILGGGISGLASAYNLSKDIPNAKITIFEASDRLGGWVDSEQVEVDDGKVLFEWGPRSLRPDTSGSGAATLMLMHELGDITKDIRGVDRASPAATNRYIYYPDHLVRMPGPNPNRGVLSNLFSSFYSIFTEPIFSGALSAVISEPAVAVRSPAIRDESAGDFVRRRYGKSIADNMLSALFHGIYAGDIYKLSARTLLSKLWYLENRDKDGNGINAELAELFFRQHALYSYEGLKFHQRYSSPRKDDIGYSFLLSRMRQTSVYSFTKGLGQLSEAIRENLMKNENVKFVTGRPVDSLAFNKDTDKFTVRSAEQSGESATIKFDYAISSLSPTAMSTLIKNGQKSTATSKDAAPNEPKGLLTALQRTPPSVNVMVVNLYYKSPDLKIPAGFGYLLPQSLPVEVNPERALGVIFGSETAGPRGDQAIRTIEYEEIPDSEIEALQKEMRDAETQKQDGTTEEQTAIREKAAAEVRARINKLLEDRKRNPKTTKIQLGQDTASGTKLTVMLGGHWWSEWQDSDLPSEDQAIQMAQSVIRRHLKVEERPMLAKARLMRNCIPQYQVGYRDDMASIHAELMAWSGGRMKMAGPWWQGGVGLNDCVKRARELSTSIREAWDDQTGLEGYAENEKWVLFDRRTRKYFFDPLQR